MKKLKNRIVFLDAGSVDYGDLSLSALEKLGSLKLYAKSTPRQIISRAQNADQLITNKCLLGPDVLAKLKGVRCVHIAATGVNNIDLKAAKDLGIGVTNAVGYSTESVVQFTFAFLLSMAGSILPYHEASHKGAWSRSDHFTLGTYSNREVAGKTIGILGYGTIGKRVAQVARAFKMNVLVGKIPGRRYSNKTIMKRVGLSTLLKKSDFLSIHAPLSPLTNGLIDAKRLKEMKPSAYLINVARGGIVDEKALKQALQKGHLAGAACDVLSIEPPPANHVLLEAKNLILTPHIAWGTLESRKRLMHEILLNIQSFQKGQRRNRLV